MKVRIHSRTLGGKIKTHTVDNFTRVEFFTDNGPLMPGTMLFQVSQDMEARGVPSLRVRAVEGAYVDGVYHGGAWWTWVVTLPLVLVIVLAGAVRHGSILLIMLAVESRWISRLRRWWYLLRVGMWRGEVGVSTYDHRGRLVMLSTMDVECENRKTWWVRK